MRRSKKQFYKDGTNDLSKRADVTIDLKRVDAIKILDWTPTQKKALRKFIEDAEMEFKIFKAEILHIC
ncbi:MAG TPA: hypothetical protein VHL77_06795 [Ferruginibacter sp.]|jgi:hypothetical protein|nr:hypothetical protein [Ferruginibacter sp.]